MNRAERREQMVLYRRFVKKANKGYDPTVPLVYSDGYTCKRCGSAAEMPNNRGLGGYCSQCGPVPVKELRRA